MTVRGRLTSWVMPVTLAAGALAGCGLSDPYAAKQPVTPPSTSTTATSTVSNEEPAPERGGTIPARSARRRARRRRRRTAHAAGGTQRYARLYVNWTADTVAAVQRELASLSSGQARAQALQAAASYARDQTLLQSGVANSGRLVAISPSLTTSGQWVLVTSEQTTGKGDYSGLPATLHVIYAQSTRTAKGLDRQSMVAAELTPADRRIRTVAARPGALAPAGEAGAVDRLRVHAPLDLTLLGRADRQRLRPSWRRPEPAPDAARNHRRARRQSRSPTPASCPRRSCWPSSASRTDRRARRLGDLVDRRRCLAPTRCGSGSLSAAGTGGCSRTCRSCRSNGSPPPWPQLLWLIVRGPASRGRRRSRTSPRSSSLVVAAAAVETFATPHATPASLNSQVSSRITALPSAGPPSERKAGGGLPALRSCAGAGTRFKVASLPSPRCRSVPLGRLAGAAGLRQPPPDPAKEGPQ